MRHIDKDICAGSFLILLSVLGYLATSQIENMAITRLSGAFYPNILLTIILLCGVSLIYQGKKRKTKEALPSFKWKALIPIVVALLLYVVLMEYIGFIISTALFLLTSMWLFGEHRVKVLIPVALIATVIVYVLFTQAFMIVLPTIPGLAI